MKASEESPAEPTLFDLPVREFRATRVKRIQAPIWTSNKARLIQRYLYYFVLVTKHGVYIDGFAGPQKADKPEMWSAKLVLESHPRWLRSFYLFDRDPAQIELLSALRDAQPKQERREPKRTITIRKGDFNQEVHWLLNSALIREKEATFCLLDQRTFECNWGTVEALAKYKSLDRKIEIFYLQPEGWLNRALRAIKDQARVESWWGRDDWPQLKKVKGVDRANLFCQRFSELGYKDVKPWPIYSGPCTRRVMYFMIHATDHPVAPSLMARAYHSAVTPPETLEQFAFEFATGAVVPGCSG